MSIIAQPVPTLATADPAIPDVPIYRLTVGQYHAMAQAGILDEDAPVELLEGWLVQKMTKKRPHSISMQLAREALDRLLSGRGWYVSVQDPITTADSEPEPDLAVVRGKARDYPDRQPGPADVPLVIEVADTTLRTDRGAKKRIYARAGIPVYWIVNLAKRQIEVYTEPVSTARRPDYCQRRNCGPDDRVPVVLEGIEGRSLSVAELLP
jgi:Uma2 family endonuclease